MINLTSYLLGRKSGGGEVLLQDKAITPSAAAQTVTADDGFAGLASVEVAGDSNLSPQNISEGVTIFGVEGKAVAGGIKMDYGVSYDEFNSDYNSTTKTATVYGDRVPHRALYGHTELVSVSFAQNITAIGRSAFESCGKLALSSLPDSVTEIGNFAFGSCRNLSLTSLPSSLTTLEGAFYSCTSLKTITFKSTPTLVLSGAFQGCSKLTVINVPWAEGEVDNAPWGATNATINYNYTGA